MKLLNVSFGLYAFLPPGWLFMAFVILSEAILMSLYLTRKIFNGLVYTSAVVSNVVSGLFGIIVSMALNGGWWLVVWFPWVSRHEVDVHSSQALWGLVIYYFAALILSVLIELWINHKILKKQYTFKKTLIATQIANAFSYAIGALLLVYLLLSH